MRGTAKWAAVALLSALATGCPGEDAPEGPGAPGQGVCRFEKEGFGDAGQTRLRVEKLVFGLEVPWAIGFLPGGDLLVTERPGRVRIVRDGALAAEPVLRLAVGERGEGGLMGLAVDPRFASNRAFYIYYTSTVNGRESNRLERYRLSEDLGSASLERVLLEGVPSGPFHNGGRLRFGPDGNLYLGTGDARDPGLSQDPGSLAGKILRISPDAGNAEVHVSGVRNVQGFDWWDGSTLVVSDHGPSGELGLRGLDEVSLARRGDNLGWPVITGCGRGDGLVTPFLSWEQALPPGGTVVYRNGLLPSFEGSILITALGAAHLHRIAPDGRHEVYLSGATGFGRLREIVVAPDGALLVTTSNCDGRGSCGAEKDLVLRLVEER